MSLVTGSSLDPVKFFKAPESLPQGSSFDLTIGSIFDHEGKKVDGPFVIKPGHMVQVVSAEVFNLSNRTTGHVTYKTTLTKKGVWALTVGIVDPGWDGPVATTLLNFSRVDHAIASGDAFLRVSFFEHEPVPANKLRKAPSLDDYLKDIQKTAASMFPATFLDSEKISQDAGNKVLDRIRKEALVWVAAIAILFTAIQFIVNAFRPDQSSGRDERKESLVLQSKIDSLHQRLIKLEEATASKTPETGTKSLPLNPAKQ